MADISTSPAVLCSINKVYVCNIETPQAGEMAQVFKSLSCKHKDSSLIPRTHRNTGAGRCVCISQMLGRLSQEEPLGLLALQTRSGRDPVSSTKVKSE